MIGDLRMFTPIAPKIGTPRGGLRLKTAAFALLAGSMLLAGCARRDYIEVGSIPDDYRTNHPIMVGEKEQVVDIPVGSTDFRASESQRIVLEGFLDGYDRASSNVVLISAPVGSINQAAATNVAAELAEIAHRNGVGRGNIILQNYQVANPNAAAPIRVSYSAMRAFTGPCGLWPKDILDTTQNKHYANFGCAYQNNLAAQVADPADLLGPRKMSEIDPENRDSAIRDYKDRLVTPDFNANSEVNY